MIVLSREKFNNSLRVNLLGIVLIIALLFTLCSCRGENITLEKNNSFFSNFKVEEDMVYIYCTLEINNSFKTKKNIKISANLESDKENGLLKDATLFMS